MNRMWLILILAIGLYGCAPKAAVAAEPPSLDQYTNLEGKLVIGEYFTGICEDGPWVIMAWGSSPGEVVTIEGNPEKELLPIHHRPGAFRSQCFVVKTHYVEEQGYYTFRIYGTP